VKSTAHCRLFRRLRMSLAVGLPFASVVWTRRGTNLLVVTQIVYPNPSSCYINCVPQPLLLLHKLCTLTPLVVTQILYPNPSCYYTNCVPQPHLLLYKLCTPTPRVITQIVYPNPSCCYTNCVPQPLLLLHKLCTPTPHAYKHASYKIQ
jgi:hypothetical protein